MSPYYQTGRARRKTVAATADAAAVNVVVAAVANQRRRKRRKASERRETCMQKVAPWRRSRTRQGPPSRYSLIHARTHIDAQLGSFDPFSHCEHRAHGRPANYTPPGAINPTSNRHKEDTILPARARRRPYFLPPSAISLPLRQKSLARLHARMQVQPTRHGVKVQ